MTTRKTIVSPVTLMTIKLDGVQYQLRQPDVDGDGQVGGTETLQQGFNPNEQMITQPTEMGDFMKYLDRDEVDPKTNLSSIDMNTRIVNIFERNSLGAISILRAMRFLPASCHNIPRVFMRMNVSMKGEGRKERVDSMIGKREHDKQSGMGGMFNNVKGMLGGGGGSA